ncbi:MAG TPA: GNAT family protein [Dehalococcoidia bacterium]|nr:GNAT family protein [Dehalococcoidia bacterium]
MLRGDRVTLRPLEPDDAPVMWRWYQDHEFSVLDGNRYGTSLPALEAFVRSLGSPAFGDVSLGIEEERGMLIGIVRLKRGAPEDRHADFGIAIERESWDHGYGADATRTILRFAFDEMNLHRVSLTVRDDNARARRCYEKCGFREEGRVRERAFHDGRWHDVIVMGILQHEVNVTDEYAA